MADHSDKTAKHYDDWLSAEKAYAELLAAFGADGPPKKVGKQSALDLATARDRADRARDKYFKRVLR